METSPSGNFRLGSIASVGPGAGDFRSTPDFVDRAAMRQLTRWRISGREVPIPSDRKAYPF